MTPVSEQHSRPDSSQLPVYSITPIGEPYQPDITVHELPGEPSSGTENTVALKARIEYLEAENALLMHQKQKESSQHSPFRIEHIQHDDRLVRFYTGFVTCHVLFLSFLGLLLISSTTGAQRREIDLVIVIGSYHPLIFSF